MQTETSTRHGGQVLNFLDARGILIAAMAAKYDGGRGLPLMLWSDPGVGKSSIIELLAAARDRSFTGLPMSMYGPEAMRGLPCFAEQNGDTVTKFATPDWALDADAAEKALVLLDEWTTAGTQIQRGSLLILSAHQVGQRRIGKHVQFILAGNDPSVGGHAMVPAAANRVGHLTIETDDAWAYHWCSWQRSRVGLEEKKDLLDGVVVLTDDEVDAAWDAAMCQAVGEVTDYISSRGSDLGGRGNLSPGKTLQSMPPKNDKRRGFAWPSSRTWDMAMAAYASSLVHNLTSHQEVNFCGGYVGKDLWESFMHWRDENARGKLPDPATFLDGGCKGWDVGTEPADRTDELLSSCVALLKTPDVARLETRLSSLWIWLGRLCDTLPSSVMVPMGQLRRAKFHDVTPIIEQLSDAVTDKLGDMTLD